MGARMEFITPLLRIAIVGAVTLLGTQPVAAAVSLVGRSPGTTGETVDFADYSICDGDEEYCQTLPYGGRYQSGGWQLTLANDGASFAFALRQTSDEGGPLEYAMETAARFRAEREIRIWARSTASVRRFGPLACSGCSFIPVFSYSATPTGDGWQAEFSTSNDVALRVGGQRVASSFVLKVSEVPEPATWTLLILGYALTGLAVRRRMAAGSLSFRNI